jgi:predicted SAM-dependent methyltransferase
MSYSRRIIDSRMARTFEYDDYPKGGARLIRLLDFIKARWPAFKASIFAVPEWMTAKTWRPMLERREWLEVGPHGFGHEKRETRFPEIWEAKLGLLDQLAEDPRWAKIFKPPWYGGHQDFFQHLHERGFSIAMKAYHAVPFPAPPDWRQWNLLDALWARGWLGAEAYHVLSHPIYYNWRSRVKTAATEINSRNAANWLAQWPKWGCWSWTSELTRPVLVKMSLGCGPHVWDGWHCLDPRAELDERILRWEWPELLPVGDCRADVVFTSHVFNYIPEAEYPRFLLEIWRVMRPGAVARLAEDATDSGYVWRRPGDRARGTGVIRSLPTRAKIEAAAKSVGFEVRLSRPGETLSPHKDVLQGDTRQRRWERGHKYYLELVKAVTMEDVSRSRWFDYDRIIRGGFYHLPGEREIWIPEPRGIRHRQGRRPAWILFKRIDPDDEETSDADMPEDEWGEGLELAEPPEAGRKHRRRRAWRALMAELVNLGDEEGE